MTEEWMHSTRCIYLISYAIVKKIITYILCDPRVMSNCKQPDSLKLM
jgi:hypothetical protein